MKKTFMGLIGTIVQRRRRAVLLLLSGMALAGLCPSWAWDSDQDGWDDAADQNPHSRAILDFVNPDTVTNNFLQSPAPEWFVSVTQTGGTWTLQGWQAAVGAARLILDLDRTKLSHELVLGCQGYAPTGAVLRVELLGPDSEVLASVPALAQPLDGAWITGTIPLTDHSNAVAIALSAENADAILTHVVLYIDDDLDGLDADQELQLGTSDQNPDSDSDGYTDLYEHQTGHDPLNAQDQPASGLTLLVPPDATVEYNGSTEPAATGQAVAYQNDGAPVVLTHSDTTVDTATGLPRLEAGLWPWTYDMTQAPNNQNLDNTGGDDWYDTAAPPVGGGMAQGGAGLFFRSDYTGSIWRLGLTNGNYTVEFSVNIRTNGTEGALGSLAFFGEKPSDANQGLRLNIKRQGQTISNGSTVTQALGTNDNTGSFHAFRVARVLPGRYELWRDGKRLTTAPLAGTNNGNDDGCLIGAFSTGLSGGWQLDDLRLTPGAWAPDAPVSRTLLRTWTATSSSATTSAVQRIVVRDTTAPALNVPSDRTVGFFDSTAPTNTGTATAFDLLDPAPVMAYGDRDYRTGLEALLTLEESDGYFRSLIGANRAFQGTAASVPGRIGSAAQLDGAHALSSTANALPSVKAVSLWFRTTATATAMLYSVEGAIFAYIQNGQIQPVFDGSSAGDPWWGSGLNNGQWHHLLAQNDGTNTVLYVDGTFLGSRPETPANLANWNRASALGAQYDGQSLRFTGALDDVAIYSRTLSAAELAALAGGSAAVVLERTWTATDASGNTASAVQAIGRTGAQEDADHDGLSNRDEELLGFDPLNAFSFGGIADLVAYRNGVTPANVTTLRPFILAAESKLSPVLAELDSDTTLYRGLAQTSVMTWGLNGEAGGTALPPDRIFLEPAAHLSGAETYVTVWQPELGVIELIFDGYSPFVTNGAPVSITGGMTLRHGHFTALPEMTWSDQATGNVVRANATNLTWNIECLPYPNLPTDAPNRGWMRWRIKYEPDVLKVDLDADTNRDGEIDENDEEGEDEWKLERGALITPPLWDWDYAAETYDVSRLSRIRIAGRPSCGVDPAALRLKLVKTKVPNGCDLHIYSLSGKRFVSQTSYDLDWPTNDLILAVSPQYARPRPGGGVPALTYILEVQAVAENGEPVATDTIQLRVAPLILPPECNNATAIYSPSISQITGIAYVAATNAGPWGQDMVKFMKYQTFRTGIRDVFTDLEHEQKGDYPKMLRESAHRDGGRIWKEELEGDGGSVMASPPFGTNTFGAIFIGSQSEVFKDHWRTQGVQPVFPVNTSWLLVGHVDEVIMFVSTNKMLYASPRLAADLLHREIMEGREQKIMLWGTGPGDTVATRSNSIARVVIAGAPNGGHKLAELPTGGMTATTNATDIVFGSHFFEQGDILRANDEFLQVTAVNDSTVTVARAVGGSAPAAHDAGIRIYALSNAMKTNLPFSQNTACVKMDSVTNAVHTALAGAQIEFVPVPVLFGWVTRQFEDGTTKSGFIAATPNLANCLVVNQSRVIFPTPGIDVFQNDVTNKVQGAAFYDLWEWHIREGSIHCAVSAIRELPGEPPWWERITEWE